MEGCGINKMKKEGTEIRCTTVESIRTKRSRKEIGKLFGQFIINKYISVSYYSFLVNYYYYCAPIKGPLTVTVSSGRSRIR